MLRLAPLALFALLVGCAVPEPPPEVLPDSTVAETPPPDTAMTPPDGPPSESPEPPRITALSDREIEGYLAGRGMGLAIPAERNHYPGPLHILELRDTLGLSPAQQAYAEQLRQSVADEAPRLGETYIAAERALDSLFVHQVATEADVRRRARAVGEAFGALRVLHLNAHVAMRDTLRPNQVRRYDELRGYPADTTGAGVE